MTEEEYTHTIWIECLDQYQADLILKVLKENLTPDYFESLRIIFCPPPDFNVGSRDRVCSF